MKWRNRQHKLDYYREYRAKHREKLRWYQRNYYRRHHPECRQYETDYKKRYPKRIKAQDKAQRAVWSGKIKMAPCMICGNDEAEMHHFDYDKPLDVVWLCKSCHTYLHLGKTLWEIVEIVQKVDLSKTNKTKL